MSVINLDCILGMRLMIAEAQVDAIVTDPPYELGFMGKGWDSTGIANSVEMWREAFRVLKPGGHLLAFSGTRTYHRMVCAIEDAGFEIRDQIGWAYGQGFPKSLDVAKAIDKARTEDREPVRAVCRAVRGAMDALGLKSGDLTQHFGGCNPRLVDHWAARDTDSQPALPTWAQWEVLRDVLGMGREHDAEVRRLCDRKGEAGDVYRSAEVVGVNDRETPGFVGKRFDVVDTTIRARSEKAAEWEGWGTALKPGWEPIVVARKPLIGTVAANVLAHGTGALNIDGCRVEPTGEAADREGEASSDRRYAQAGPTNFAATPGPRGGSPLGRWPANLVHDGSDEVVAAFPQAPGQMAAASDSDTQRAGQHVYGAMRRGSGGAAPRAELDKSAARFFYCAKASKADREDGNTHPTVKPTALMRYLCRLVTPPGGLVLDPFAGSGSTGKAAHLEGFRFVGFEQSEEYAAIANARIGEQKT